MTELHFSGHPEIAALFVPDNATQLDASVADDGSAAVQYFTPDGEANLDWFPASDWAAGSCGGMFETTSGMMEYIMSDGTIVTDGAYSAEDATGQEPDVPEDIPQPDFSTLVAPPPFIPLTLDLGVLAVGHDLIEA